MLLSLFKLDKKLVSIDNLSFSLKAKSIADIEMLVSCSSSFFT